MKPYTVILMFPPAECDDNIFDASHIAHVTAPDHLAAQDAARREAVASRAEQYTYDREESDAAFAARCEDIFQTLEVIATYEGHLRDLSCFLTLEALQKDKATT